MAIVALMLAAGCVALPSAPREDAGPTGARPVEAPPERPTFLPASENTPPLLPVTVHLGAAWLKPLEATNATATVPPDARLEWLVGVRGGATRMVLVGDAVYVAPERGYARAGVGPLDPGDSGAMRFDAAGRHVIALADDAEARLSVDVRDGAPSGTASVFVVDGASGARRFVPERIDVAPDALLVVRNQANATVAARETRTYVRLAAAGSTIAFTPVDEGVYDVVAIATATAAQGEASAPFLVDFDKPAARIEVGPFSGQFVAPDAPGANESVAFATTDPVRALRLRFHGQGPLTDSSFRVRVSQEGRVVADVSSAAVGALELRDLPAGRFAVEALAQNGVLVDYEVDGEALLDLPLPARVALALSTPP